MQRVSRLRTAKKKQATQRKAPPPPVPPKPRLPTSLSVPSRRQRSTTLRTAALTMSDVLGVIEHDKKTVSMSNAGAVFTNMYCNPFQTGQSSAFVCRVPTGSSQPSGLLVVKGRYTLAANTCSSGFAQLFGLAGAGNVQDQAFSITYGADALDSTATMTTVIESFPNASPLVVADTSYCRYKLLGAGLRCSGSGIDTESGRFRGGNCASTLRATAATWTPNAQVMNGFSDGSEYGIKQGITVRRNPPDFGSDQDGYQAAPANCYISSAYLYANPWGPMPTVQFFGLSPTTVLYFDYVYYLEYSSTAETTVMLERPEHEPELQAIYHLIAGVPVTAEAHTFASFLKSVWKGVSTAGKYVWNRGLGKTVDRLTDSVIHKVDALVE